MNQTHGRLSYELLNEANHFEVFGLTKYINKNKYYRIDELSDNFYG